MPTALARYANGTAAKPPQITWPPGLPILVVGLPKAGTSTIHEFLSCHGLFDIHYQLSNAYRARANTTKKAFICDVMHECVTKGLPAFDCMEPFHSISQMDCPRTSAGNRDLGTITTRGATTFDWLFPQISYLAQMLLDYPRATYVLNLRDATSWASSVEGWLAQDRLAHSFVLASNHDPNAPFMMDSIVNSTAALGKELERFFNAHTKRVRKMVQRHGAKLIEVSIDGPDAQKQMTQLVQDTYAAYGHTAVQAHRRPCKWSHSNQNQHHTSGGHGGRTAAAAATAHSSAQLGGQTAQFAAPVPNRTRTRNASRSSTSFSPSPAVVAVHKKYVETFMAQLRNRSRTQNTNHSSSIGVAPLF